MAILRQELANNLISARSYSNMLDTFDAMKDEISRENLVQKVYLGSAIVGSIGLSAGYVVWLLRGGMLLSSLLSSLPAWRVLDPLPILARKKDDDESDDDESLEAILDKPDRKSEPRDRAADSETDSQLKKR